MLPGVLLFLLVSGGLPVAGLWRSPLFRLSSSSSVPFPRLPSFSTRFFLSHPLRLLELQHRQMQRGRLRAELSRMENMLLDLEDNFSTSRQRLHEYDEELTSMVRDKEDLIVNLAQVLALVQDQKREADEAIAEKAKELDGLRRLKELHICKAQQLEEIDAFERKLSTLKAKNAAAVTGGLA